MLILASASAIRSQMLSDAGVDHRAIPAEIDEDVVKARLLAPADVARQLAEAKAVAVSAAQPGAWVIGSDSVVAVDGRRFGKPRSRDDAVEHLRFFSGRAMTLVSAVALARGGKVDWSFKDEAILHVRELSPTFIADYLEAEWPEVGQSVGVFRMEGRGVQLFERVEGSHFTILGMPLVPLLEALRDRAIIAS